MKYPEVLKQKIKTAYWDKYEELIITHGGTKSGEELYNLLESSIEESYYSTYGSFRKALCKHRKTRKKVKK